MRTPIIAGNWKMNGSKASVSELAQSLFSGCKSIGQVEWVVFPPFVFLQHVEEILSESDIAWGGQDLSLESEGAYTGDISAAMLLDFGCQYVLIGHSERRQYHAESNDTVATKTAQALEAGLKPIVCVGESLQQRNAGQTLSVISEQVQAILALQDLQNFHQIVFAYEPVWAIGTGQSATPQQAQEVHAAIREQIRKANDKLAKTVRILYGGSVKPENAAQLSEMSDIDGALVGGASLIANKFIQIGELWNK